MSEKAELFTERSGLSATCNTDNEGGPIMGLDGPAREIKVEPVTLPAPAREPAPAEAPEPVKTPAEDPVPA